MAYELEARIWALPKHQRYGHGRYITLGFCDRTHSNCINADK